MPNRDVEFERRFEEWSLEHPGQWTYTGELATFVSEQITRIRETQLEAADRIVVSQDRIASGIDKAVLALRDVTGGLENLRSLFEWGFSELIWQLEQQRELLQNILNVLQAPLDTQAKELKKRAEEAYRNDWIEDSLQDFLESEKKNRYDFTIQQYLGDIYFRKKNAKAALEYYEKAVKYARSKSAYHASWALLRVGLVRYLLGDYAEAREATLEAIKLSPRLHEAHYQHAQYCAKLKKFNEAIEHLKKAILGDRYYLVKVCSEKDFNVMRQQLRSFEEEIGAIALSLATGEIERTQELLKEVESYGVPVSDLKIVKKALFDARAFLRSKSLFDYWDAMSKVHYAQEETKDASSQYLSNQILELEQDTAHQKSKISQEIVSHKRNLSYLASIAAFFLVSVLFFPWAHSYYDEITTNPPGIGYTIGLYGFLASLLIVPIVTSYLTFHLFPYFLSPYYGWREKRLLLDRLGPDESNLRRLRTYLTKVRSRGIEASGNPVADTLMRLSK